MYLLVYFIGTFVLLSHCGQCELTWEKVLSARLDDIVFDMKSKDNSMTKQIQKLTTMVTATNQKLASFEKRLSEVADCSANFFVADERFSNIETHVKEVAVTAAEVGRRTHLLRRGLEQEKAATTTQFESLRKNQEKLLSLTEDIERFQGSNMTREDDIATRLNETRIQISNLEQNVIVLVSNTSTFLTTVKQLENTQAAMKGTEEKTGALIAVIERDVKSTKRTFQALQSQVQALTQADIQSKTRGMEAQLKTTRADIFLLQRITAAGACAPGWFQFQTSCYKIEAQDEKTFTDAKKACEAEQSHLAIIMTTEENQFVKKELMKLNITDEYKQFFMDGTDLNTEGTWVWESNGEFCEIYDWSPGEPNKNNGPEEEDCMTFMRKYDYQWNDESCDFPQGYVCEKEMASGPVVG